MTFSPLLCATVRKYSATPFPYWPAKLQARWASRLSSRVSTPFHHFSGPSNTIPAVTTLKTLPAVNQLHSCVIPDATMADAEEKARQEKIAAAKKRVRHPPHHLRPSKLTVRRSSK